MDVYEYSEEVKQIPIIPQLISLGVNHSLCISKTNVSGVSNKNKKNKDDVKPTTSYLNVLSWGKVPFNCLGQGVDTNTSEYPRVIPFFSGRKITQVSCGDYHSAVLVSSSKKNIEAGTVFTFGLGNNGRLGYHIDTNSEIISQQIGTEDKDEPSWCTPVPQPVGVSIGLRNVVTTVSCGANHTLVSTIDGCVYSWGMGTYGVLGYGGIANRYTPTKVEFPSNKVFICKCDAGSRHSMALDSNGNVWSWGYGGNGRLGLGNTRNYYTPNMIEIFDEYEVFQISCGDSHSACLDRFGTVYTWGCCRGGKLGLGKMSSDVLEPTPVDALKGIHIVQVSCGTGNTLALSSSGKIYQWGCTLGFNKNADGLISNVDYLPQQVPETGFKNVFVVSGPYSCAAINIFGDLLTWGLGTGYRLGHGDSKDHVNPKFVSYLRTRIYIDTLLKVYDDKTFKIEDNLKHDGTNPYDEKRIQQISVGDAHGALLTCNGTVYTWGVNNGTGYNSTKEPIESYSEPILFNHFSSKVSKITCGSNHTLAVTINGLLFSWGCNDSGQLGHGDLRSRVVPDLVTNLENCINVFAGIDNSGVITSGNHEDFIKDEYGTLWVFGSSTCGKLGLGEALTSIVMTPREITTISGVYKLALGSMHSVALCHDGTLYSAGAGTGGRLGTGDTKNSFVFTEILTDYKFVDVCAGSSHSLAVSIDNELYGWGEGKYLTLEEKFVLEPTLINTIPSPTGTTKVVSVVAAANHSLILTDTGYILGFGDNSFGQLGVQLSMKSSSNNFIKMPYQVNLDSNVTCISTSRYFSSCSNMKGDAYSWGLSSDDRLGIGYTKNKIVYNPAPIVNTSMVGDMMDKFELDSYKYTSMSGYETILNYFLDELYYSTDQHSVNWKNLQIILKNEEKMTSEISIKTFEDDLIKCLKTHVDFILNMNESYTKVKALQFKLMAMVKDFCSGLGSQKKEIVYSKDSIGPFRSKLSQIENMVEMLFLQPAYFVRLSLYSSNTDLVSKLIQYVYQDLNVPRVHNQYFALLRSLLKEEIDLFFNPSNPLNASFSPFARILKSYCLMRDIVTENAHLFLSTVNKESVVSHLISFGKFILIPDDSFETKHQKTYKEGMNNFGSFVIFLSTVLTKVVLHNNIKVLFMLMHKMVKEKIPPEWASPSVPLDYLSIFPLIPVFVYAFIQPFFKQPNQIAEMCGLPILIDENVLRNLSVISQYFEYIVNPELTMPAMPKLLRSIAQTMYSNLSKLFLEYLRSILYVEDDFYIDITMDTFKSHFDMDYLDVNIPSYMLAHLVNVCHSTQHYLNLSAHDPLVKVVSSISGVKKISPSDLVYSKDFISKLEKEDTMINIKVDHRFMVYDRNMSFCTYSNTFVPQKLAYRQSTYSEDCVKYISLIVRYTPFGKHDPCKIVQKALVDLDDLKVQYGTFDDVIDEMHLKSKFFSNLSNPDFKSAGVAKEAFEIFQKLKSHNLSANLLTKTILEKCLERIKHRKYLLYIYQHQNEIEQCRRNFESSVSYNVEYLTNCINAVIGGYSEPYIKRAATKYGYKLFSFKGESKKMLRDSKNNVASYKEHSCLDLYRNGILIPGESVTTNMFNRLKMVFSANIDTGCYITLRGVDPVSDSQYMFLTFEILQRFVDSANSGYHQLFVSSSYPFGMFVIKTSFLVDTFMSLIKNY